MTNINQFTLETHNYCNNNCTFCFAKKNTFKLSLEKIQEKIDYAKSLGMNSIMIMGGEPTLDKDFLNILDLIISNGLSVCVTSNGIKLADEDFFKKTISKVSLLRLSIHSHKQEILNKFSKHPNLAIKQKQTLDNIEKYYKKYNLGFGINIVINHLNYHNLFDFIKWLNENYSFIKEKNLLKFKLTELTSLDRNVFFYEKIKYNELIKELTKVYNYLNKQKINYFIDNFPLCLLNKTNYHLNRITKAKIDGSILFHNIGDEDFSSSEKNDNFQGFNFVYNFGKKVIKSNCIKCKYVIICPGNKNVNFNNNETDKFIKNLKERDLIKIFSKVLLNKNKIKVLENIKSLQLNYKHNLKSINNSILNKTYDIDNLKDKDIDYIDVKDNLNIPFLSIIIGKSFFGYFLTKYQKNDLNKIYNLIFSKDNKTIEITLGKNFSNFYKKMDNGLCIRYNSNDNLLDTKIVIGLLIKLLRGFDIGKL